MEEPLNFDYQALADEQECEHRERSWQYQCQAAFLWLLLVFVLAGIFVWLGSFIRTGPVMPVI